MADLSCVVCGVDLFTRDLHRVNPKGETGVWACREHWSEAKRLLVFAPALAAPAQRMGGE